MPTVLSTKYYVQELTHVISMSLLAMDPPFAMLAIHKYQFYTFMLYLQV